MMMDDNERRMLGLFVKGLNTRNPHPRDWERFYDFIVYAFSQGRRHGVGSLTLALEEQGLSYESAIQFARFYEYAIPLLGHYCDGEARKRGYPQAG
jgi:hypothetical protein